MLQIWNDDGTIDTSLCRFESKQIVISEDDIVKEVKCGSRHIAVLLESGKLYTWGNNYSGQLGLNCKDGKINNPQEVKCTHLLNDDYINGIACGSRHTYFWTKNGLCFGFGNNYHSQLTYDFANARYKENQFSPFKVRGLEIFGRRVKEVACGARHSLFCFEDGSVTAVGCNDNGQLGRGDREAVPIAMRIEEVKSAVHISCGSFHSFALTECGILYMWGYGKACGSVIDILVPTKQPFSEPISMVCGGDSHSLALSQMGVVFSWGSNNSGQLGIGKDVSYCKVPTVVNALSNHGSIKDIASRDTLSAAVSDEGRVFYWGKTPEVSWKEISQAVDGWRWEPTELNLPPEHAAASVACTISTITVVLATAGLCRS